MNSFSQQVAHLHHLGVRGCGVAVGHLDGGVDPDHLLLAAASLQTVEFGYRHGELQRDAPTSGSGAGGHGTHTASLIVGAAPIGVAPAATLLSGAVIEAGNPIARIVGGLDWLADQQIFVACLSLGVFTAAPVFETLLGVLADKDVLVVAAAGNRGPGHVSTPGSSPWCLTVAAADTDGRVTGFSGGRPRCHGGVDQKPDVLAPGVDIPGADAATGEYRQRTGTSSACALIAGVAALLRGAFPMASAAAVRQALQATSAPVPADQAARSVFGMVQPLAAHDWLAHRRPDAPPVAGSEPHSVDATPIRHIDPRLIARYEAAAPDGAVDALFEFTSARDRDRVIASLGSTGFRVVRRCRHVPIVMGAFARPVIGGLLSCDAVKLGTVLDVDPLAQSAV